MAKTKLPKWVRRAIFARRPHPPAHSTERDATAVARHKDLWRLILGRWLELEQGFVPALGALSDLGKRVIFDCALVAVRDSECLPGIRKGRDDLLRVNEQIVSRAIELATLLREAGELREEHSLHDTMPDLWDELESASERFAPWAMVCNNERNAFLRIAREQSRPGPELEDVLDELVAKGSNALGDVTVTYPFNVAIHQAATGANHERTDKLRLLIECVTNEVSHREVPARFALTNDNLACLAEVLYNWDAGSVSADTLRRKIRPGMVDESIGASDSARRFGIVRFRPPKD